MTVNFPKGLMKVVPVSRIEDWVKGILLCREANLVSSAVALEVELEEWLLITVPEITTALVTSCNDYVSVTLNYEDITETYKIERGC